MFWANGGLGLMSCGMGFWELFHSGKATVYRESITSMEETSVTLSSARKLPTDLVVFCTGYNDDITTLSRPLQESLGLPNREYETTYPSDNKELDELADEVVKISFPALANTPKTIRLPRTQRKSPLYRRMISPQTANDIVFMGQIHTIATPILAHVQALWAVAFLTGRLSIPSRTVMEEEIALWNAWTKRRYLSQGYKLPYSIYDFHSVS
jgi:dimethylaniline monooxygenase (N-oxide forming)